MPLHLDALAPPISPLFGLLFSLSPDCLLRGVAVELLVQQLGQVLPGDLSIDLLESVVMRLHREASRLMEEVDAVV